ncbi:MAG TPA: UPF0182 family protein [Kineosporiaceae bacterium]|nr:UPF0182 family protein [Kineosporiaceae bacterium]
MSFSQDPRRGPRPVVQRRRRGALAPTLAILGVLVVGMVILAQIWTDVLWFRQLGYVAVYRTEMLTRIGLFVAGGLVMAGAVLASLMFGYRSRPVYAPVSPEQASLDRYRDSIEPLRKLVVIVLPIGLGLFAGSAASQEWKTFLLWVDRVSFGAKDPQFHLDIGFFVFTLPWLNFLTGFFTAVVVLSGLSALVTHYLYGGLRLQGGGPRMTAAARIHLGCLAAAFLLLRALDSWLGRFELSTRQSKLITGLTYTDANAVLTARGVLAAISLIVAILFVVAAVFDGWRMLPVYGVGLLVVTAIVIGQIYPAIVQRFQVTPSAQVLESPYIQRNINATRDAFGLSGVSVTKYAAKTVATPGALRNDAASIPGIRLMDPTLVSQTFRQLEQNKQYYNFPDVLAVDRYDVDGQLRDTVIAVRELSLDQAPAGQRNWYNDHIVYTHGFGVVAAYGNQRTGDGKPVFFQSGIPSTGALGDYQPRVYFGEQSPEYSIVGAPSGSAARELDFPDDKSKIGQQNNTYAGSGGVKIGSTFNRLLYSIKFREQNILLSDAVNGSSRILYDRHPRERVQKVAPFLTLDGNPYPAVVNGRVTWILDGYTTTDQYPYSALEDLDRVTSDSLTQTSTSVSPLQAQQVNYMRNSVKATVDAYDGSVTLYAWDENDPVLKAWRKVFPNLVKPMASIDGKLMQHLRYPEDLFKVQRDLLSRYHVTDPGAFFSQQDYWQVPKDPTDTAAGPQQQPPYYLTLQMPGQNDPSFSLTSTFIPASGASIRDVLTGFLAVDADAGSTTGQRAPGYGQLRLLELPRDSVVPGPGQVQNNFTSDTNVSPLLNQLRIGGKSTVEYGNLLTLPLGGGLLYVEPVYVRSSGEGSYPLLQRVLVAFGAQIGFSDTLDGAINQVFNGTGGTGSGGTGTGGTGPTPTGTATTPAVSGAQAALQQALKDAAQAMKDSDTALKAGDFAAYGQAQARLKTSVQAAVDAEAQLGKASTPSPSPSATTPAPAGSPASTATGSPSPTSGG